MPSPRPSSLSPPVWLLAFSLVASALPAWAAEDPAPETAPAAARGLMSRWLETQQLISREKQDWQQAREMLQSRTALVSSEIATLEERLGELRGTTSEADGNYAGIAREEQGLRAAAASLGQWAGELEARLRELGTSLPEPLQAKVRPLFERMPADPSGTRQSLAERYQNLVGILNEINQFNGQITLATEVRPLAGGKPAEVQTIYVGLGQAYFVSAGGEAGSGRPAEGGWQWESDGELAPDVLAAVEILQNKGKPKFIALPVKIR